MILAAGLGTRLRPLTANRPKALVPVGNEPVIERVIRYLEGQNISEIIVNAHHHHKQVVKHFEGGRPSGTPVEVRVEPEILGTGGGIKNVADFWGAKPFVVINGDVLTNIGLREACESHRKSGSLATLVLHDCRPFNQVQVDDHLNIVDIGVENLPGRLAFTGIHIIDPELLNYVPEGVFQDIIVCYRELIGSGKPIKAHISREHYWRDMGTIKNYFLANREALEGNPFLVGPGCRIHTSVKLREWAIIGEGAWLEDGAEVRRSILWEDVRVEKGRRVIDSVVTSAEEVVLEPTNTAF